MKSRSLPLALALIAAPWALFRRKAKDGWLGELEEIRGDALGGSRDEIGTAMAETSGPDADAGVGPRPAEPLGGEVTATVDPWGVGTNGNGATLAGGGLAASPSAKAWAPPPAPHREHPSQLWHASLEVSAARIPEVAPEERVDLADLAEPGPSGAPPRRAFAPSRFTEVGAEAAATGRPDGLDSFDDRVRVHRSHTDGTAVPGEGTTAGDPSVDSPVDPPVDVLAGRDLLDEPAPGSTPDAGSNDASDSTSDGGSAGVVAAFSPNRPRIKPPPDIFDAVPVDEVAPVPAPAPAAPAEGSTGPAPSGGAEPDPEGGLVDGPVRRRSGRGPSRRSLFGGGAVPGSATGPTDANEPSGPAAGGGATLPLEISAAGEVIDDRGVIRLAESTRPEIVQSAAGVSFPIDTGWCWVARFRAAEPVRVALPTAVLVVPAGTRALVVVEADHSTFVSVASGTAHLEHPSGPMTLAAGSIAHVRVAGPVTLDTASPDEMAADAILTRNLRLDDALDAVTRARAAEAQAPVEQSP